MIVQLPRGARLDAACLTGWTRPAGTPVLSGAVVVSAAYRLLEHGAGPRVAVPVDAAVVFADEGEPILDDDDEVTGFDLVREADIALEKERTDIVVQGHLTAATTSARVRVAGADWLLRTDMSGSAPDITRNLFGWLARTEEPRALAEVPDIPELLPDVHLPGSYHPGFNNAYRRSPDTGGPFETPHNRNRAPLPSGALVEIFRTSTDDEDVYSFTLPDLTLSARLRAYCGHGPDEAPAWRIVDTLPLTPDTLIVEPDQNRATVLWRVAWPYASQPADRWRLVQILSGGN